MKRLILSVCAMAALAAPLGLTTTVAAEGRHGEHGGGGDGHRGEGGGWGQNNGGRWDHGRRNPGRPGWLSPPTKRINWTALLQSRAWKQDPIW